MPHIIRTNREFPSHAQIGSFQEDVVVAAGDSLTYTAEQDIFINDPMNPGTPVHYSFLFWNLVGQVSSGATATASAPGSNSIATAWYVRVGGGDGPPGIQTWALWAEHDQLVSDTPIQSVTPSEAWPGGNNTGVSPTAGSGPRVITARETVPTITSADFDHWLVFGSGSAANQLLTIPASTSCWGIAVYAHHQVNLAWPDFDIYQQVSSILEKLLRFGGDPSPEDLTRVLRRIAQQRASEPQADTLTQTLAQIDQLDRQQLKTAAVEVQARINRLEAAKKMLDSAIKEQR